MNLRIRDKLMILITAPLTVLAIFIATAGWIQIETRRATVKQEHWNQSVVALSSLLVTLSDAQAAMRGYVITGIPRFKAPYETAAAGFEPELARLTTLSKKDKAERGEVAHLVALARKVFSIDAATIALVDRGQRPAAVRLVEGGAGNGAMERFRVAVGNLERDAVRQRVKNSDKLDELWRGMFVQIAIAAWVALAVTIGLYMTITRSIADRLRRVGEDALAISRGLVPASELSGNDEISQLNGSLHEIIARAREREESLSKYRLMSEQAQHIILWLGPNNEIVEANKAALDAYGYSRAELLALPVSALRTLETRDTVPAQMDHARQQGSAFYETMHLRKNGEEFPAEVSLSSTIVDGKPMVLELVRDISERKRAEAVTSAYQEAIEAALRLKSEFVATVSHEIRTPMNAVIGMTELLLDTELTGEQRQHTEVVRDASFALLGIIDNILDFSKIEAGQMQLELRETNITDLVESAATVLAEQAHRKGISLMTFVAPQIPAVVLSDQMRVRQVLINLIGNAVKFTEVGGVVVSVTHCGTEGRSSLLRFTVKDSGVGFDAVTAEKIFEPFRQADGSTTRKYGGTGLGLSICRQLVDLMGGKLTVESTPGVGSEFTFTLSVQRGRISVAPQPSTLPDKRVLVADNDEAARWIVSSYVRRWDMVCDVVANGEEALATLRRSAKAGAPYDVAIIDYAMPKGNGLELAARIKDDQLICGTPLIMITAFNPRKGGHAAIEAGFSCYLTKPIRQSHLFNCIAEATRDSHETIDTAVERRKTKRERADGHVARRSERILLVEDDSVNQLLAQQQLRKLGFATHGVVNGEQAVNALAYEHYDLVLMDCQMPVMDGFAAARAIRRREAKTGGRIPIIAMTANARREDRDECLAAGMDDYLAKPVQMEHLRAMLDKRLPEMAYAVR